jgi:hydroxyethylthiazole kinase-like uncharacterized protein yjeF
MGSSKPILSLAAHRDIEEWQRDAIPPLMERAGQAACKVAKRLLGGSQRPPLIVAGPGNNGGDAFVVARLLKQDGIEPVVVFAGDAQNLPDDARHAYVKWLAAGGILHDDIPDRKYALAIDGLFGIGLTRPLTGRYAALVARLTALPCPMLALDIPSGLDSETGQVLGVAIRASHTATFIALKPGLLTLDGPDHCGEISVHDLGQVVDGSDAVCATQEKEVRSIAPDLFTGQLQPRRMNSHKGNYGSVGIIGGAPGMAGAALLAGRAALQLGAGRVYVGMLDRSLVVDPQQPELMLRSCDEIFSLATCVAVGPGLGQSAAALALLRRAIDSPLPLLLDADALNLLAAHPVLLHKMARRGAATLLTPHPLEAARLLGCDSEAVQADRLKAARELARHCQAETLLKGCGSIIALPDGRCFFNTTGNPGLATAGSGDVLSGMAVALLAQGWPAERALIAATHLHGAAADVCVINGDGPIGLSAGELIHQGRRLLNRWIEESATHMHNASEGSD